MSGEVSSWAAYYDGLANDYDHATTSNGWFPNRHVADLLAGLELAPETILDLGSGTGQTATELAGLYPRARLTLVEPSLGMAAVAAGKLPDAALVISDAERFLGVDTATYDLVTAVGFLELTQDPLSILESAAECLTPGGHLALTHEPHLPGATIQGEVVSVLDAATGRWVRRLRCEVVQAAADACGLTRVASREFVAYQRGDTFHDVVYEAVVWRR